MSTDQQEQKPDKKRPGKKPLRVKIDLDPEEALRRLLAPKEQEKRRKSGSTQR